MASLRVKSVLITGANRGIGLEFVKQFLKLPTPPQHIFATYRDKSKSADLLELERENDNLQTIKFEAVDYEEIPNLTKLVEEKVGNDGLTMLINNAAVLVRQSTVQDVEVDDMVKSYHVNTVGPLMLIKHLLPLLKQAAVKNTGENNFTANRSAIIYVSTKVSSIDDNGKGGIYPYRCSKIASNMFMKNLSIELKSDGILCLIINPGWVQTEMGGGDRAIHGVTESVQGMLNVVSGATESDNGTFCDFKGMPVPW